MKKLTTEQFIEKAKSIHGNKYDYSSVEYKNIRTDVKIFCKKSQKYFYQLPANHLKKMVAKIVHQKKFIKVSKDML